MNKKQLVEKLNIRNTTIANLDKGENVNTDVLVKICKALNYDISDIVEILQDIRVLAYAQL